MDDQKGLTTQIKKILGERRGRKKKKEVKPWGKKERALVLATLLFTFALILLARVQSQTPISFLLPQIGLKEETLVFEKEEGASPAQIAKVERVKQEFFSATQARTGTYAFYLFNLATKQEYGVRQEEIFPAASLIKLPVILTLYQEVEKGNASLETRYRLKDEDKVGGAGSLQYQPAGAILTYRELARLMGKESDNTAFKILRGILGDEKIKETADSLGMQKTLLEENETTPRDIGIFLRKLWGGAVVSNESRDEILGFLTDTSFEDSWMPDGVPIGIRVAHKVGIETRSISDAGIIFSERPFVLVLMSRDVNDSEARRLVPELTRIFWEAEGE